MHDITPTLYMTSYAPYITSLHSLSSHHCSSHITSTAFKKSHTLYMTSHTWQHKSYICHLTLYIWPYICYICVIKPCVSIVLHALSVWHHTLYVWHHIQYAGHHMKTLWHHTHIGMTSHPLYLWHHIQYIWYHPYCFMKTKRLFLACHPLYLSSQPLNLCGHTCSNNAFTTIMEVFTLDTRMTSYTPYITSNSDFMTSIVSI